MDSCEIFIISNTSYVISSYVLKYANIISGVVDVDGMKVVRIPKSRKWWKKLSDSEKLICTSMLEVYCDLSPHEEGKLIEYIDSYQQFHILDNISNEKYMHELEEFNKRYKMV